MGDHRASGLPQGADMMLEPSLTEDSPVAKPRRDSRAPTPVVATLEATSPRAVEPRASTPRPAIPMATTPRASTPRAAMPRASTRKAHTPANGDVIDLTGSDNEHEDVEKEVKH